MHGSLEEAPACAYCGYSRAGTDADLCPECGRASPDPLCFLPTRALLPWERGIARPQIWRFLGTIGAASFHYIRYLHTLAHHGDVPLYQGRWLNAWIALSAFLTSFGISLLDSVLGSIWRHGLSPRWINVGLPVALRVAFLDTWPFWIAWGVALLVDLLVIAGIIAVASRLTVRENRYAVALCAVGPPILVLGAVQLVAMSVLLRMGSTQIRDLTALEGWFVESVTVLGAPVCCWLALRIVWRVGRRVATVAAIVVGSADWWFRTLILTQLYELMTHWALRLHGGN